MVRGTWHTSLQSGARHLVPFELADSQLAGPPATRLDAAVRLSSVITAIVFIQADVSRLSQIAEQIADIDGVSEVYSVTGDLDLLAMVRVREVDDVATVVADQLNKVDGVLSTQTQIAFQTFSQHDLEQAFSIGLERPQASVWVVLAQLSSTARPHRSRSTPWPARSRREAGTRDPRQPPRAPRCQLPH